MPAASRRRLLFWEPSDQAILVPQIGANTVEHLFGLLGRRRVIVGNNRHNRRNQPILGVVDVEPIFVHLLNGAQRVDLSSLPRPGHEVR
jgi:hypothetical protein